MRKGAFYLNSQILSIYEDADAKGHMYVPAGAVISLSLDQINQDGLIEVIWNEQKLHMFSQDIRERADRVDMVGSSRVA